MRVELQNGRSGEIFLKQLLVIGNSKIPVDTTSENITIPANFCHLTKSKPELI